MTTIAATDSQPGKLVPTTLTNPAAPRGMLALLTAAAFVIFAQIFMVAPILPTLAGDFHTDPGVVGLAVPAYLVPYGAMVLLWGSVSERWGRRPVILASLAAFTALTAATSLAVDAPWFILLRLSTALGSSGVVPIGLALIGDLVPYHRRGRAFGWMFGGMAGGMAVGAAGGALGEPVLGWHGLFGAVSTAGLIVLGLAVRRIPTTPRASAAPAARIMAGGFTSLLRTRRGRRTYSYVLANAVLHSGIYTWLGVYLHQQFGLGETRMGLVLLGYGIPGLLLGPVIGRLADRYGRAHIIPLGLTITAACAVLLAISPSLTVAQAGIVALSLGYDMTQPPLAGIVTDLPGHRGQAMGLNACTLFVGMGTGSLVFQAILLPAGFLTAVVTFAVLAALAGAAAIPLFRTERPARMSAQRDQGCATEELDSDRTKGPERPRHNPPGCAARHLGAPTAA